MDTKATTGNPVHMTRETRSRLRLAIKPMKKMHITIGGCCWKACGKRTAGLGKDYCWLHTMATSEYKCLTRDCEEQGFTDLMDLCRTCYLSLIRNPEAFALEQERREKGIKRPRDDRGDTKDEAKGEGEEPGVLGGCGYWNDLDFC